MAIQPTNSLDPTVLATPGASTPRVAVPAVPAVPATKVQTADAADAATTIVPQHAVQRLEDVQHAIERLKQSIKPPVVNSLEFQIDQSTGKTLVKIMDTATNTLVRQIPSEEVLAVAKALDQMEGRGGLVKQQV